jgi:hypothetical protein
LAHVLRQEYLVNILQSIAEAALFYHPAVWWVSGQIRTERELCCDDLAVEASGDVLTYATALAELDGRRRSRLGTVLAADGGSLVHRIRRLAGKSEAVSHNLPGPGAVWALAILWLAGIGAVALHAGQRPPAHVALRPFTPVGIAAAPRVMLPAPPLVKGPPAPPMLAALLFDPFFAAPQAPASPVLNPADADRQLAKLTGVVLSSSGPVANATVILPRRYTPGEPIPASGAPVPTTRTDAAGKFSFERLTPGSYTLRATHPAYLPALYGAQTSYAYVGNAFYGAQSSASVGNTSAFVSTGNVLTLTEGQQIAGVTVKLIEPATVSGRVVDEDGDPFVNADIQVLQLVHFNGRPQVSRVSGAASGDDGRFKVEMVPPGKYYLRMGVQPNWTVAERAPVATVKPGQKDLRPNGTYLGGTTEWVGATMIEVEAAQKLAIGDVRILNDTWVHVRGKVIGDPALLEGARVIRMPREPTGRLPWSYGADIQKDGSYDLAHVWSGGFTLTVMKMNGETYGWKPIVVDHEDLAGIVIDAAATQLRGFVRLEGGDQPAPAAGAPSPGRGTVVLTSAEGPTPIRSAAMVKPDGSFAIPVLAPGRYVADVTGLPAGSYLKSIRVGGVDVLNSALDWNGGDNRTLEAVISAKAAVLQGVAQDEDGKPAPGSTVTLVPVPPSFGHSRLYPSATADQQGHFQFPSVCPGTYKVFAWEEIGDTAHWDPEYIKPFESQGESVQLDEGGHATVKPTKISAPAMQEALRKAGQ